MSKAFRLFLFIGVTSLWLPTCATAASLTFDPTAQTVTAGQAVGVDIVIGDLGDLEVGDFDLDVSFDPAILTPLDVEFGPFLGDPNIFEADAVFTFSPGLVDVAEVSFLSGAELDVLQSPSFLLARLLFGTLAVGTSALAVTQTIVDDASAQPIPLTVGGGSIEVTAGTAVPEPGSVLLLGVGLAWVIARRRRSQA